MEIIGWNCDTNFPIDQTLLPHKSQVYNLPVILKETYIKGEKLAVGMHLIILNKQNEKSILDFSDFRSNRKNLIWSNEVQVP